MNRHLQVLLIRRRSALKRARSVARRWNTAAVPTIQVGFAWAAWLPDIYGSSPDTLTRHLAYGIDCAAQKSMCTIPQWTEVMSVACAATCGLCGVGTCKDAIAGCAAMKAAHMCNDYTLVEHMRKNCARTCGLCASKGSGGAAARKRLFKGIDDERFPDLAPPTCADSGNCPPFLHRCNDPDPYWSNIMHQYCAKSCGFCQ